MCRSWRAHRNRVLDACRLALTENAIEIEIGERRFLFVRRTKRQFGDRVGRHGE
jgi:hypothetical protein